MQGGQQHGSQQNQEQVVLDFLRKKGYKNAEYAFKHDAKIAAIEDYAAHAQVESEASVSNYILFHNTSELATGYTNSFADFREWVFASLDLYRVRASSCTRVPN